MVPVTTWTPPPWPDKTTKVTLTEREGGVLYGICEGRSNFDIGVQLELSPDQVKYAIKGIFRSLKSNDRARCAVLAATGQVEIEIEELADRRGFR